MAKARKLVFPRGGITPYIRDRCMTCGVKATHSKVRTIQNPKRDPVSGGGSGGGGGELPDGIIGLIFLVFYVFILLYRLVQWWLERRSIREQDREIVLNPATTEVTVASCDRHRRYWPTVVKWVLGAFVLNAVVIGISVLERHRHEFQTPAWIVLAPLITILVSIVVVPGVLVSGMPCGISWIGRDEVHVQPVCDAYFERE